MLTNEGLADELCSPLSSEAINDAIPGCIFGDSSDVFDNDVNFDNVGFVSDIDDGHFVDVDFDRGIRFVNGNNHNPNGDDNKGGDGPKGPGK